MNSFTIRYCAMMILLFFLSSSAIAQFSADMVTTNGDITQTSKFYSEKPYYRMDMEEGGQQMFVVVNTETNITQVFMPSQQMYMEMKSDDIQSTSNDVFQSLEEQKKKYETKMIGEETINGYECEVYEVLADGSPVTTYWQSAEIEYPIKVVTGQNKDMIMELKNIEKGDVDNALFAVPAGYTKMNMQGMMQMK
jgi:hypothetical protein